MVKEKMAHEAALEFAKIITEHEIQNNKKATQDSLLNTMESAYSVAFSRFLDNTRIAFAKDD